MPHPGKRENLPAKGPGRPKGKPNKLTVDLREAIKKAYEEAGGVDYLKRVAQTDPKTFCALLGKIIPQDINASLSGNLSVTWKQ